MLKWKRWMVGASLLVLPLASMAAHESGYYYEPSAAPVIALGIGVALGNHWSHEHHPAYLPDHGYHGEHHGGHAIAHGAGRREYSGHSGGHRGGHDGHGGRHSGGHGGRHSGGHGDRH